MSFCKNLYLRELLSIYTSYLEPSHFVVDSQSITVFYREDAMRSEKKRKLERKRKKWDKNE